MSFFSRTGRPSLRRSCLAVVSHFPVYLPVVLTLLDTNEDADHGYLMFSATFNKACRELARKYLADDHVRIRIGRAGSSHLNVEQQVILKMNEEIFC